MKTLIGRITDYGKMSMKYSDIAEKIISCGMKMPISLQQM